MPALNREDLIEDPRFKTAGDRFVNVEERKQITAGEIKNGQVTKCSSDWIARVSLAPATDSHGVDGSRSDPRQRIH